MTLWSHFQFVIVLLIVWTGVWSGSHLPHISVWHSCKYGLYSMVQNKVYPDILSTHLQKQVFTQKYIEDALHHIHDIFCTAFTDFQILFCVNTLKTWWAFFLSCRDQGSGTLFPWAFPISTHWEVYDLVNFERKGSQFLCNYRAV